MAGPAVALSAITSPGAFPPRFARMEKPFDSRTRAKQFARSSPQLKNTHC